MLRSQLNGEKKIQAIIAYTLPVVRYPVGIISWPKEVTPVTSRQQNVRAKKVQEKTIKNHEYIRRTVTTDHVLSEYLRHQKPEKEEEAGRSIMMEGSGPARTTGR